MRTTRSKRLQLGHGLADLWVGLALGSLVLTWAGLAWGQWFASSKLSTHRMAAWTQQSGMLDWFAQDIALAQYNGMAHRVRGQAACNDAFCGSNEDFQVSASRLEYSVDRNHNGSKENNECSGFRWQNGLVQMKTACTPPTWTAISDDEVLRIEHLSWRVFCSRSGGLLHRWVQLELRTAAPQVNAPLRRHEHWFHIANPLPWPAELPHLPSHCSASTV